METIKNSLVKKKTTPRKEKLTMFKKIQARICHNCPVCNHARKNPESRIEKCFTTDIMLLYSQLEMEGTGPCS